MIQSNQIVAKLLNTETALQTLPYKIKIREMSCYWKHLGFGRTIPK